MGAPAHQSTGAPVKDKKDFFGDLVRWYLVHA
jgi:hypothetical protein